MPMHNIRTIYQCNFPSPSHTHRSSVLFDTHTDANANTAGCPAAPELVPSFDICFASNMPTQSRLLIRCGRTRSCHERRSVLHTRSAPVAFRACASGWDASRPEYCMRVTHNDDLRARNMDDLRERCTIACCAVIEGDQCVPFRLCHWVGRNHSHVGRQPDFALYFSGGKHIISSHAGRPGRTVRSE